MKNIDELKEIRGYKKEDMLYPDRCMLKWQGMMLSDHSEALFDTEKDTEKDKEEDKEEAVDKPRKMGQSHSARPS